MGRMSEKYSGLIAALKEEGYDLTDIDGVDGGNASTPQPELSLRQRVRNGEKIDLSTLSPTEVTYVLELEADIRKSEETRRLQEQQRQNRYINMDRARRSR